MIYKTLVVLLISAACSAAPLNRTQSSLYIEETLKLGLPKDLKSSITTVFDFNQDSYPDLFFAHFYSPEHHAYINSNGNGFKEIKVNGLQFGSLSRVEFIRGLFGDQKLGAVMIYSGQLRGFWGDKNENGRVDLYTVDMTPNSIEFKKQGTLTDLKGTLTDVQFLDYNEDGLLDLAFSRFYAHAPVNHEEEAYSLELYQGTQNFFSRVTEQTGLAAQQTLPVTSKDAPTPVYELSACDIDGDGRLDLLAPGYGRRWNKLYLNLNGKFENWATTLGFHGDTNGNNQYNLNGNSFGTICTDADNDQKIDIFQGEITHLWAGDTSDVSSILWNQFPNAFLRQTDLPRPKTFKNQGDLNAAWGDIDLDGLQDLLVGNTDYPPETKLLLWKQTSPRIFQGYANAFSNQGDLINAMGVVLVDWDLDGDLDIVTSRSPMRAPADFGAYASLLKNQLVENNMTQDSWLSLSLKSLSPKIAYTPIGAKVQVELPSGSKLTRFVTTGFGRLAQTPESVHFGLGKIAQDSAPLKVTVQWNSKIKTEHWVVPNKLQTIELK